MSENPRIADLLRRDLNVGPAKIVTGAAFLDASTRARKDGLHRGVSTGWPTLDTHMQMLKQALYVVTGIPSHGKGAFTKATIVNTARMHGWRWVMFVPEDWPLEILSQQLVELAACKPLRELSDSELSEARRFITEHLYILDTREPLDLETMLCTVERMKQTTRIDGVLIDPWNELESTRPNTITETDFIGACLARCRTFAQVQDVSFWIVAHPTKLRKLDNGKYPVPDLYDISGSQHWNNKPTFGLTVWRDFEKGHTDIHVKKVRFRYYGYPGVVRLIYDPTCGQYREDYQSDAPEQFR